MGSILHRLIQLLTIGLQKELPVFVDDSKLHYGQNVLKINFQNFQTCSEISNASRVDILSTGFEMKNPNYGKLTIPAVPKKYVSGFDYCHEDISAWYSGVLIAFLTEPTNVLKEEYELFESKYLKKLSGEFLGVQIRSTDKVAKAKNLFRHPSDFHSWIKNWEIFEGGTNQNVWVASDNRTYYQTLAKLFPEKILGSLNLTLDVNVNRYNPRGLQDFFLDVYAMQKSSLVIGTHSSNILRVLYELRSVDDIFASSKLISLDSFYSYDPSLYYGFNYKTVNPNFCFKSGHSMLEPNSSSKINKCFESSEKNLQPVSEITLSVTRDFRTPVYGFHRFKYVFTLPNSSQKSSRDCMAPLFALEKVQVLV